MGEFHVLFEQTVCDYKVWIGFGEDLVMVVECVVVKLVGCWCDGVLVELMFECFVEDLVMIRDGVIKLFSNDFRYVGDFKGLCCLFGAYVCWINLCDDDGFGGAIVRCYWIICCSMFYGLWF